MDPPNPPVVTMEQLMGMQAQLMQAMMHRMDNEPVGGPPPVHVRDKHGEFIKGHPLCQPSEPHGPHIILLSTRCTYACLFFIIR
jgi:hypothetical protein